MCHYNCFKCYSFITLAPGHLLLPVLPPPPPPARHANVPCTDFEFDRVLGPSASQSDVYHAAVKPVVEDVLNG